MITTQTFKFLTALAKHNDRTWFQARQDEYAAAREDFRNFVQGVALGISTFDSSIQDIDVTKCIFRIHRDVRFSKDKSPYKTHFGAHLGVFAKDVHDRAGYYIHVEPGGTLLAGGAYTPPAAWLTGIRAAIDRDGKALEKVLDSASFRKTFGELAGESLKTVPRGYAPDHPRIAWLKHKSFLAMRKIKDDEAQAPGFLKSAVSTFKALKPFNEFLNRAAHC
jgi:uncharacterized protein (TIGR02453 family)